MFKNTTGQKVTLLAIDISTNAPKTGDAANLTVYVEEDDGGPVALADTSATEVSSTNAKGMYRFDVAQAETNANKLLFTGKSTTANVEIVPLLIFTRPATVHTDATLLQSVYDYLTHAYWGLHRIYSKLVYGVAAIEVIDKSNYTLTQESEDSIVAAVHNADLSTHVADGSAGKALSDAVTAAEAAETAATAAASSAATAAASASTAATSAASAATSAAAAATASAAIKLVTDEIQITPEGNVHSDAKAWNGNPTAGDGSLLDKARVEPAA